MDSHLSETRQLSTTQASSTTFTMNAMTSGSNTAFIGRRTRSVSRSPAMTNSRLNKVRKSMTATRPLATTMPVTSTDVDAAADEEATEEDAADEEATEETADATDDIDETADETAAVSIVCTIASVGHLVFTSQQKLYNKSVIKGQQFPFIQQ